MNQTEEQSDISILSKWFNYWKDRWSRKWALIQSGKKPLIVSFDWEEAFPMENGSILLKWQVHHAHHIAINRGIGEVEKNGEQMFWLEEGVDSYTITARGGWGKVKKTIQLKPVEFKVSKTPKLDYQQPKVDFMLPKPALTQSAVSDKQKIYKQKEGQVRSDLPVCIPPPPSPQTIERLKKEVLTAEKQQELIALQNQKQSLMDKDLLQGID